MGNRYKSARTTIVIILVILTMFGFAYEMYDIQVTNHEIYAAQNNAVKTYTVSILSLIHI